MLVLVPPYGQSRPLCVMAELERQRWYGRPNVIAVVTGKKYTCGRSGSARVRHDIMTLDFNLLKTADFLVF